MMMIKSFGQEIIDTYLMHSFYVQSRESP